MYLEVACSPATLTKTICSTQSKPSPQHIGFQGHTPSTAPPLCKLHIHIWYMHNVQYGSQLR